MTHETNAATPWSPGTRPGWSTIVELAEYLAGPACRDETRRRTLVATVEDGRLVLEADDAPAHTRGMLAGAMAVAAETCEACGGKGDPIADAEGLPAGCRCSGCRRRGMRVLARAWTLGDVEDHPEAVSPGQWTADIRGGSTGNDWDDTNWRHYRRLETACGRAIGKLMAADADEEATQLWAGGPGWAGLLRALFITMRPEQDERPGSPDHTPWRLRWMKEKFGGLDVRTTGQTPYQSGAVWFIEIVTRYICIRCGQPGTRRNAPWIRYECDACWTSASAEERAEDERHRTEFASREPIEGGFRGMRFSW